MREVILRQIRDLMRGDNIPKQIRNIDGELQYLIIWLLTLFIFQKLYLLFCLLPLILFLLVVSHDELWDSLCLF
jgi:hypothetical protein